MHDTPNINDDIPYMYEDNPYMYDDIRICTMIYQICMHDTPDMNDDIPDMYEYHIHVWYHVAWREYEGLMLVEYDSSVHMPDKTR